MDGNVPSLFDCCTDLFIHQQNSSRLMIYSILHNFKNILVSTTSDIIFHLTNINVFVSDRLDDLDAPTWSAADGL